MKHAFIQNNIAQEVVQSDPFMLFVEGYAAQFIEVPDVVMQGWRLDGTQWKPPLPPAPVIPQSVTRFQAKAALDSAGLLDSVEAIMGHADTPRITKLAWADAQTFNRQSSIVLSLGALLSLSDSQLDALFVSAAAIN